MGSENPSGADNQQERPGLAQWVVGFVDGEGCFSVPIFRNRTTRMGWQVQPAFTVVQSARSREALLILEAFFRCGHVGRNGRHDNHREAMWYFTVRDRDDLSHRIMPFFEENPLVTAKADDFKKFCTVVRMMEQRAHLTVDGLIEIAKVAERMNRRLPSRFLESSEAIRQPSRTTPR
jgi:LAGLIDADG endonuclease